MEQQSANNGLVFVLVGPSGVGKNTLMRLALDHVSGLRQLPTATTRPRRDDEQEGREHFFLTDEEFDQHIEENALLEWQWVHGKRYGIIRKSIEDAIRKQDDLIADIEVLGASILKKEFPNNTVLLFVSPPQLDALEDRIRKRGADTEEQIKTRLSRVGFEMKFAPQCDYLIVNDDLERATNDLLSIIFAERSQRNIRQTSVAVRIRRQDGSLLVPDGAPSELPRTRVRAGESTEDALMRLLGELGIVAQELQENSSTKPEDLLPVDMHLSNDQRSTTFSIVFAIDVEDQPAPPGWHWQ